MCSLQNAVLEAGFVACQLPVDISRPRSIIATGTDSLLALERGRQSVVYLTDSDGDGLPDSKRDFASASGLNHGLEFRDGYVYASSDTTVYRWPYVDDFVVNGEMEVVIENMNADGNGGAPQGHTTRTLIFDDRDYLYISVGSNGNVDQDSHRSRIRRFYLDNGTLPLDFQLGEVFADGLRNEVGLAFDKHGDLWGVENGADDLFRSDLGGSIKEDNPAEELNRFREEDAGKHWGYPFCWTEFKLPVPPGLGNGAVWAWPSFLDSGDISDDECRQGFVPAIASMQGHSAPLGITFYQWQPPGDVPAACGDGSSAFPQEMDGYAFVAFHGSWNRDIPTGFKVVYIPMDTEGNPSGISVDLLAHEPPNAKWENGFRPVDVSFDHCGRLLLSSDGTSGRGASIVRIGYNSTGKEESATPSAFPTSLPTDESTALTISPTASPSLAPSLPSTSPSNLPIDETPRPTTLPSALPSISPSNRTLSPSATEASNATTPFCGNNTEPCESSGARVSGLFAMLVSLILTVGW